MLYGIVRVGMAYRGRNRRQPAAREPAAIDWSVVGICGLFIVLYTMLHLVSWANVRYRLPVDAFLILFAAYGIQDLLLRLKRAGTLHVEEPR